MNKIYKLIAVLIVLSIVGIYISSKYYYERSFMATIAEIYLKVTKYGNVTQEEMEAWLKEREEMEEKPYELPKGYEDILITEGSGMKLLNLNPDGKGEVVLYLHGGSYLHDPDPNHFKFLNKLIPSTDIKVILPVYPKAPKNTFKYAYEKVIELYKEMSKDKSVILMGDSAGGGFVLGLAQEIKRLNLREPKKLIVISPWVDLTMENPDILVYEKVDPWLKYSKSVPTAKSWSGGEDLKDPRLSPTYGDISALKNLTIFIGTRDILYPDVKILADKVKDVNLIIGKNLNHDYPFFPIPEAKEAINQIIRIVNEVE
ncbi:alpha/beta hydrolase [Streptobacillus felis]|uniref:alpha/beta hydrolase fold domain-containing protein n=1 Tax=Streptobacillus felis TaxID=1384509 RepID=UPI00082D658A|nr:alpha/beta hydrolase [Streptobacillus felis]